MFAGLGHDALVCRDDQQHKVNARRSGHHIAYKTLVPGHVHHAHALAVGQGDIGKAQFNGDAPALFLFQAIAVDAGKRAHKAGFAVVDMSGCAHDDGHVILLADFSS